MKPDKREQMASVILAALLDAEVDLGTSNEIAFHLTDWTENLEELSAIYNDGKLMSPDEVNRIIFTFLAHVPNHIAAAKKLIGLGSVEDVFDVGVCSDDT